MKVGDCIDVRDRFCHDTRRDAVGIAFQPMKREKKVEDVVNRYGIAEVRKSAS